MTVELTRKERIVFALDRSKTGQLPTSKLCLAWGERDSRRGYRTLDYYRSVGLLETISNNKRIGDEAVWMVRQ